MPATAQKTLATELQITITNTLTEIPFLDNIEVDLGENKIHSLLGVNMTYEVPVPTGVRGTGSISADVVAYDPTDSVHQKVVTAYSGQARRLWEDGHRQVHHHEVSSDSEGCCRHHWEARSGYHRTG
jgi:hypothetical protein